jgi:hypothetical protein
MVCERVARAMKHDARLHRRSTNLSTPAPSTDECVKVFQTSRTG